MSIDINDMSLIPVINRGLQSFHLQGRLQTPEHAYYIPERVDEFTPSEVVIPFSDIKYINNLSNVFKNDLEFNDEYREIILKKLGINKMSVESELNADLIKDIILNPTTEKLEKIIAITSVSKIGLVKRTLTEIINSEDEEIKANDISERVVQVIDARYDEINRGVKNSEIKLKTRKREIEKATTKEEKPKTTKSAKK